MMNPVEKKEEKIFCPANGWDCPYYHDGDGACMMKEEEGVGPLHECDDYDYFFGEDGIFPDEEPADIDDDCGYDPYMGCYTDDC